MAHGCDLRVTVVDLFIDEGHRLGAFYLYKALALAFYVCIPRHHALRLANNWLRKMNCHKGAENVDKFGKLDLFSNEFLDQKTRDRSEIRLLEMINGMSRVFDQFTAEVKLLDKMLDLPILDEKREQEAKEMLVNMPTIMEEADEEPGFEPAVAANGRQEEEEEEVGGLHAAKRRLDEMSMEHARDDDVSTVQSLEIRDAEKTKCHDEFRARFGFTKDAPVEALIKLYADGMRQRSTAARAASSAPGRNGGAPARDAKVTLKRVLEVLIDNHNERCADIATDCH